MKLTDLKIGDEVETYCAGEIVKAKVTKKEGNFITVTHRPVRWGRDEFTETIIKPSTVLQYRHSKTTPKAWYNNKELTD